MLHDKHDTSAASIAKPSSNSGTPTKRRRGSKGPADLIEGLIDLALTPNRLRRPRSERNSRDGDEPRKRLLMCARTLGRLALCSATIVVTASCAHKMNE